MGFFKRTIRDVPLEHTTVLLRADYNVPLATDGSISDDFRIRASLPTIQALLKDDCKVVIISHLGRPQGVTPALSLEPIALRLAELLGEPVRFVDQTIGDKVHMAIKRAPMKSVIVLENLRFSSKEEANDPDFAQALARDSGASYFVQDGFGVVHRAHASTDAITQFLPSVAGLLLEKEYTTITTAMHAPARPLVAILGGAKISDKIQVIEALIQVADRLLIGGAMANTFLAYKGFSMGASFRESNQTDTLARIYQVAAAKVGSEHVDSFIVLPTDVAVAEDPTAAHMRRVVSVDQLTPTDQALDIGDETAQVFADYISEAATVIWNGPVGMSEYPIYSIGSQVIAADLADHSAVTSIIGGGDTADFVLHWDPKQGGSFTHVSTGGGASLELMAGKKLPGIESLLDSSS